MHRVCPSLPMVYFAYKFFKPRRLLQENTDEDHSENREGYDHIHNAQQNQYRENLRPVAHAINLLSNFRVVLITCNSGEGEPFPCPQESFFRRKAFETAIPPYSQFEGRFCRLVRNQTDRFAQSSPLLARTTLNPLSIAAGYSCPSHI